MIKKWLKRKLRELIDADHIEMHLAQSANRSAELTRELSKFGRMDVDVGFRGPCSIVLTGMYRGKGYVQFYDMDIDEFKQFVEMFRNGSKTRPHAMRNVDAPREFLAAFDLQ